LLLAIHQGIKKRAENAGSGQLGTCPWTGLEVKAHVGHIRQYWAYCGEKPNYNHGYEPESEWHISWKEPIKNKFCEVIFGNNNEHRADILGSNDTVIEIQHSVIDIRDSKERVRFYREQTGKRVIWVVDIQDFWIKRFSLKKSKHNGVFEVEWKPKRSWLWQLASTPETNLYLEFNQTNDKLLHSWIHNGVMYVKYFTKIEFFERYLKDVAKDEYVRDINKTLEVISGTS